MTKSLLQVFQGNLKNLFGPVDVAQWLSADLGNRKSQPNLVHLRLDPHCGACKKAADQ